jgi:hypothetical protein
MSYVKLIEFIRSIERCLRILRNTCVRWSLKRQLAQEEREIDRCHLDGLCGSGRHLTAKIRRREIAQSLQVLN